MQDPSVEKLETVIRDMRAMIQDISAKDTAVKREIERVQNENDGLAKEIIETDIAIEKCEKGRELDSKYLFQQDEVLAEMQRQMRTGGGPSKTTVQNKVKPGLVAARPDPSLLKSNRLVTQRI